MKPEWARMLEAIVNHPADVSGLEFSMAQNFRRYRGPPKPDEETAIEQAYARIMAKEEVDG